MKKYLFQVSTNIYIDIKSISRQHCFSNYITLCNKIITYFTFVDNVTVSDEELTTSIDPLPSSSTTKLPVNTQTTSHYNSVSSGSANSIISTIIFILTVLFVIFQNELAF